MWQEGLSTVHEGTASLALASQRFPGLRSLPDGRGCAGGQAVSSTWQRAASPASATSFCPSLLLVSKNKEFSRTKSGD